MKKSFPVKMLVMCALFAALLAVCSQIAIPLPGGVPINLAILAVLLCGALMSKGYAVASVAVYVLIGLVGVPVFANMMGGPAVLFGKTGGYILGYLLCAFLTSWLIEKWGRAYWKQCLAMAIGVAACYVFGTVWFMAVTGLGLWISLTYCVFPFLIGDALKIALASFLSQRLEKPMHKAIQ